MMHLTVRTYGAVSERAARKEARAEIASQVAAHGVRTKSRIDFDCTEPISGFWNCTAVVEVEK